MLCDFPFLSNDVAVLLLLILPLSIMRNPCSLDQTTDKNNQACFLTSNEAFQIFSVLAISTLRISISGLYSIKTPGPLLEIV